MSTQLATRDKIQLLQRVREYILENPEKYDQNHFCGSPCCIAGWVAHLTAPHLTTDGIGVQVSPWKVEEYILSIFGGSALESIWLFRIVDRWPDDLEVAYTNARTGKEKAEVGARAIDRYISELQAQAFTATPVLQLES